MNDNVKCCNCNFKLIVPLGAEKCPVCGYTGALAWLDKNKPETAEPVTPPEIIAGLKRLHRKAVRQYKWGTETEARAAQGARKEADHDR